MRRLYALIGCWLYLATSTAADVPVLVYHDIFDAPGADDYAVTGQMFREQMKFLKQQGYRPISLRQFAEAAAGKSGLPEKPVVLSFDDGLVSFRDIAMPVLADYEFPAILSVVTGWVDGRQVPQAYRDRLLSWEQLRVVSRSPLVEILSHTDNLHTGILANPQGNQTPASITRRYDAVSGQYETEAAFRIRIRSDLARSVKRLRAELGKDPPGIAWPYGFYDQVLAEEAAALGMHVQLTLDKEPARLEQFPLVRRIPLRTVNTIAAFENMLRFARARQPLRIIEIELDEMAKGTAAQQDEWLSALLNRLSLLRANAVLVNPFTRDGSQAFFRNGHIPLRAEVLHRVLHQLRTRASMDYLLLRLPAIPAVTQAAEELARRHPYDGIMLATDHRPADAAMLLKLFDYYHPGVRCGREQGAAWRVCQDFTVMTVELPITDDRAIAAQYAKSISPDAGPGPTPVYFMLSNRPDADGKQVASALHKLRYAGAQNYGLRDGLFLDKPENLRRVATELAGHALHGAGN